MLAFALSQPKLVETLVAAVLPVLQTRTPTGNWVGPVAGLLLSRPIVFQVMMVAVSDGAAVAVAGASSAGSVIISSAASAAGVRRRPRNITRSRLKTVPYRSIGFQALPGIPSVVLIVTTPLVTPTTADSPDRARRPLRVLTVIGTRPEAIKMAPVIHRLAGHDDELV